MTTRKSDFSFAQGDTHDTKTGQESEMNPLSNSPARREVLSSVAKHIFGYQISQAIFLAVKFGIPEMLLSGPHSVPCIAERASLNLDAASRLLRALASIGIFEETEAGVYGHTDKSRVLVKSHPSSLAAAALYQGSPFIWRAWGALEKAMVSGLNAFEEVFGKHLFAHLAENIADAEVFNAFMREAAPVEESIAGSYDFGGYRLIADVGGGQGTLLGKVLEFAPEATGILFESQTVIEQVRLANNGRLPLNRIELRAGNFFENTPSADLILLKYIVHDWDDERATRLLCNCRDSLSRNGRILIIEKVLEEAGKTPAACFSDLMMLATTGGKERTLAEFQGLLRASDLQFLNRFDLGGETHMSIIEASLVND